MNNTDSNKFIELVPGWRSYFWYYLGAAILVPLIIGIVLFWLIHRHRHRIVYRIYDSRIVRRGNDKIEPAMIDLLDIGEVRIQQTWIEKRFDSGTVVLVNAGGSGDSLHLLGMYRPGDLQKMIRQSIERERRLQKSREEKVQPKEDPASLSLDNMDYLTGLWQQGLISNEDFEKERKHFEK